MILIILFIWFCITTKVPDKYIIDDEFRNLEAYSLFFDNAMIKRDFSPLIELYIDFWYDTFGEYYNTRNLNLWGRLFIKNPYKIITIHELSILVNSKKYIILENKIYKINDLTNKDKLVNKDKTVFHYKDISYYWTSVNLKKDIDSHFLKWKVGSNNIIKIVQIYSFDNGKPKSEEISYHVVTGTYKLDIFRILYPFFPPQ